MSPVPNPVVRDPVIVTVSPRKAAVVRIEVPAARLGEAIGLAIGEVTSAIAANSLFPIGGPFTHYLSWDADMVVAEVGFPVTGDIIPRGRVVPGELPGGTLATTFHLGTYDTIGESYGRLEAWIRGRGKQPADTMWEVYLRGPGAEADPAQWRTEIYWPYR